MEKVQFDDKRPVPGYVSHKLPGTAAYEQVLRESRLRNELRQAMKAQDTDTRERFTRLALAFYSIEKGAKQGAVTPEAFAEKMRAAFSAAGITFGEYTGRPAEETDDADIVDWAQGTEQAELIGETVEPAIFLNDEMIHTGKVIGLRAAKPEPEKEPEAMPEQEAEPTPEAEAKQEAEPAPDTEPEAEPPQPAPTGRRPFVDFFLKLFGRK